MVRTYLDPPIFGWPEPGHLSDCEEGDDDAHVDGVLPVYTDDDNDDEDAIDDAETLVADRSIRQVHIPKMKFQCRGYPKVLNWNKELKTEPPLISRLSDN